MVCPHNSGSNVYNYKGMVKKYIFKSVNNCDIIMESKYLYVFPIRYSIYILQNIYLFL